MAHLPTVPSKISDPAAGNPFNDQLLVITRRVSTDTQRKIDDVVLQAVRAVYGEDTTRHKRTVEISHCQDNAEQAKREREHEDGCVEDLYMLGKLARNAGWRAIIVMDALALRQITGKVRPGESSALSVVVIQTRVSGDSPVMRVKRMGFERALRDLYDVRDVTLESYAQAEHGEDSGSVTGSVDASVKAKQQWQKAMRPYTAGMTLHDPLEPPFSEIQPIETRNRTVTDKALEALPQDLKSIIIDEVEHDTTADDWTGAPRDLVWGSGSMEVVSITPLPERTHLKFQSELSRLVREAGSSNPDAPLRLKLHRWKAPRTATRSQIAELTARLRCESKTASSAVFFFDADVWASKGCLIAISIQPDHPFWVARFCSVRYCAIRWMAMTSKHPGEVTFPALERAPDFDDHREIVMLPSRRFSDETFFQSYIKHEAAGGSMFMLTKTLKEKELDSICNELRPGNNHDIPLSRQSLVPWYSEEEFSPVDHWTFFKSLLQYPRYDNDGCWRHNHQLSPHPLIIYNRPEEDLTLIWHGQQLAWLDGVDTEDGSGLCCCVLLGD